MNKVVGALRILVGLSLLGSVVWQVSDRLANNVFRPGEYFAYFSIDSALIGAVTLTFAGWWHFSGNRETTLLTLVRLSSASYLAVTGLAYNLLLRDSAPLAADIGYEWPVIPNEIIHVWGPILIALDFLVTGTTNKLALKDAWKVLYFPLAWAAFSVIRGVITGWWPYWFVDPTGPGGLPSMLGYTVGLMSVFLVIGFLLMVWQRMLVRLFSARR
jgi:hypothetical protein